MLLLPAFWVVVALLAVGGARMAMFAAEAARAYPVATATAIGLFALYAVPFWLVVGQLDYLEREPPFLLAVAFAWGGLVATSAAIPGNAAVHNLLAKLGSPDLAATWGSAIAAPSVEELAKLLGVVAIVLIARDQVNSVLDGVVYGALVGLGFQVVEDIVFAVAAVAVAGQGDTVQPVITTFFLRGFLAGLWSHTVFSALAGAGIGYLVVRGDRSAVTRLSVATAALFGAWACHFLWNSPLLADGLGHGALGVLVVLLLKGSPSLVMILLLTRWAHRREADYYAAHLAALGQPLVATAAELRALSSGARRAHARRHARHRVGWRGWHAVRRLQRAQARLAVELSRAVTPATGHGPAAVDAVGRRTTDVLALRRRLATLGHPEALAPPGEPGPWRRTAGVVGGGALALAVVWAAINALGVG
jgi:RsiW-degrading membrane proteinase PrsW (M82 family)